MPRTNSRLIDMGFDINEEIERGNSIKIKSWHDQTVMFLQGIFDAYDFGINKLWVMLYSGLVNFKYSIFNISSNEIRFTTISNATLISISGHLTRLLISGSLPALTPD